jgi:hypothetical protein
MIADMNYIGGCEFCGYYLARRQYGRDFYQTLYLCDVKKQSFVDSGSAKERDDIRKYCM